MKEGTIVRVSLMEIYIIPEESQRMYWNVVGETLTRKSSLLNSLNDNEPPENYIQCRLVGTGYLNW